MRNNGLLLMLCLVCGAATAQQPGGTYDWEDLNFTFSNSMRFEVSGYSFAGFYNAQLSPFVNNAATYTTSYGLGEVVSGFEPDGQGGYRPSSSFQKGDRIEDEYIRIRPWLHLYTGDNLSFHLRADIMTGTVSQSETPNNLVDFFYMDYLSHGIRIQAGMLPFNEPVHTEWHSAWGDPNNLVLAGNGGMGIASKANGDDDRHIADGYEGVQISTTDLLDPVALRLGYLDLGHSYFSDEINLWTLEGVYRIDATTRFKLYEYLVRDKKNVQYPGLGGDHSHSNYTGAYLQKDPAPWGFTANAIYLDGKTNLDEKSLKRDASAAVLTLDYKLAEGPSLGFMSNPQAGLKYAYSSGDNNPNDHKDSAWWGVDGEFLGSYLFFDYGWALTYNYQLTAIDPNTGMKLGVQMLGPYLKTTLPWISPNLTLDAGLYKLWATKRSPRGFGGNGKRDVGVELDATFEYFITKHLSVMQEMDYIFAGDLYNDRASGTRAADPWKIGLFVFYYF